MGRRHRGVITAVALASSLAAAPAYAADLSMPGPMTMDMSGQGASMDMNGQSMDGMDHAAIPAGVYGAGMVGAGHFMFSYTPSYMRMEDNYIGSSIVSPDTIATTVKLPMPMMMMGMTFDTYRIVPTSMDMQMHMFHAMYGVTDWLNIMVMGAYDLKSMTMLTYKGAMGDTALGSTTNRTSGFGDTSVMSLWRVYKDPINEVHINVGLSLPTGSTTETMNMLMPMGTYMTMRANYGMQLGTGTVDLLPGVTYLGHIAQWSWGAIYRGRLALGDNTEGYEYGYRQEISGWAGYRWIPGVTSTFRVQGEVDDRIHGADPQIMGLMQGSNPYFYGGQRINLLGGLEVSGAPFGLQHVSLAIEGGAPVYQNLNGPQLGEAWQLTGALHVGF
ncbi:alpha-amylase [Methylovirgula ligni]|nr:alpha-amylase [Methylovirgula ligni]